MWRVAGAGREEAGGWRAGGAGGDAGVVWVRGVRGGRRRRRREACAWAPMCTATTQVEAALTSHAVRVRLRRGGVATTCHMGAWHMGTGVIWGPHL